MDDEQKQYVVIIPEVFAGEVMGKLTVLGAALEDCSKDGQLLTIKATSIEDAMNGFESWLSDVTNGQGIVRT